MHAVSRLLVLALVCLLALVASPARADPSTGGTIHGEVNYPSDHIPPLLVYAMNTATGSGYYVATAAEQRTFTMVGLPPGTYHVVARSQESPALRAGYTAAVLCGLESPECSDHTLVPVTVTAGAPTTGIKVFDWYAPEGAFPAEPAGSIPAGAARLADTGVTGDHLSVWIASILGLIATGFMLRRLSGQFLADRG